MPLCPQSRELFTMSTNTTTHTTKCFFSFFYTTDEENKVNTEEKLLHRHYGCSSHTTTNWFPVRNLEVKGDRHPLGESNTHIFCVQFKVTAMWSCLVSCVSCRESPQKLTLKKTPTVLLLQVAPLRCHKGHPCHRLVSSPQGQVLPPPSETP